MATSSGSGPGGFSYAQAARGRQATTASAATAASVSRPQTSGQPDLTPSTKDWAEDVEAHVRSKTEETGDGSQSVSRHNESKSNTLAVKPVSKGPSSSSGVSSPDIAASATSHDDLSSSAQNGSSLSSWEAKSQSSDTVVASEPAWIVQRKERQSTPLKGGNTTIMPEQKPVVLHEAPPPTVNPWAKRAEQAKAKAPAPAPAPPAAKPVAAQIATPAPQASSKIDVPSNARSAETTQPPGPRKTEAKTPVAQPPPVKDEISWPTPETSQETERKSSASQLSPEEKMEDESAAGKPRKKQEWKPVAVVPNIIWETPGVRERRAPANGDRAARGNASTRGRGGSRGGAHTTHHDRSATIAETTPTSQSSSRQATDLRDDAEQDTRKRTSRKSDATLTADDLPNGSTVEAISSSLTELDDDKPADQEPAAANGVADDSPISDFVSTQPRRDSRTGDASKEQFAGSRGSARRGRGRGGARDALNGHAYYMTNGYPAEYMHFNQHPGAQFTSRGTHQTYYNRASLRHNGSRTYSVPEMQRYQSQLMAQQQYAVQGYPQGYPEYVSSQMPVAPTPGQPDLLQVATTVTNQVDYYFSVDNLANDTYLRRNMDSQGFVLLEVVATFNRLKLITTDYDLLKFACANSEIVELVLGDDSKERLRKANDWQQYVMPNDERIAAARNEGPQHVEHIGRLVYPWVLRRHMAQPQPMYMTARGADRRSHDFAYVVANPMSPQAMFTPGYPMGNEYPNGADGIRSRQASAPALDNTAQGYQSPALHTIEDSDVFPDQKIEQLTVCVKLSKNTAPQYNAASRTFSNGSIDTKVVAKDTVKDEKNSMKEEKDSVKEEIDAVKDEKHAVKDEKDAVDDENDIVKDEKSTNGETASDSSDTAVPLAEQAHEHDISVFWIKDNDQPVGSLPNGLTPEPYLQLRLKAMEQHSRSQMGDCPHDLDVLYQFWSHFLIRNFNNKMYTEFVHFAHKDHHERCNKVGRRNLVKFYDEAIKSTNAIPLRVAKDYIALAQLDRESTVFKNLFRAWRDGSLNLRNRKRVSDILDAEARQLLEG